MSLFKLPNNSNERPRRLLIQPSATSPFCTTPSQLQEVTLDPDATNFSYVGMRSPGAPPFNSGRSVKEIDEQLTNLRKENFNLKLRIYFLEERMGSNFNADKEDAIKKNIELMVELENVRKELEDKQELLCQAVKAMEIEEEQKRKEIESKDTEINDLKNVLDFDNRLKAKRHSQDGTKQSFFSSENLDLSKSNSADTIRKLQDTIDDLERQLRKERERPDRFGNTSDVSENVRSKFKNFENQIEMKNFKLDTLSYELEKSNNQIAMCNLQMSNLEKDLKEKGMRLQDVLVELKRKDDDLTERDVQLQDFSRVLEDVQIQMEKKDRKIEKYRTMLAQCENKNEEMMVYIDNLKCKIQNLEIRLEAALDEVKKDTNKSEFVLSSKQGVKSSNTDVELFSVSNSLPLSETPTKATAQKTPLKLQKSHTSLHSISSSQFISPEKSKSLNNRSSNNSSSPRSEPLSKSSSMIEINPDGSLSHEELLELKRNHYKACKIIKTMIQKKNEYVEQIDKLENLVSEKSSEIETLKTQVAKLSTIASPRKKSIQERVCEMNITASSNPAANKENSLDQNKMNLAGQYKELADELETKIELLSATLHEKDNQIGRLKVDVEAKSNQIIDLEFEILALNQGVGQSFNTTTSEHETTIDKLFREKLEKDQVIEKLECELRKRTCDLQGIVNNELWEKNRSIEKLEIALKSKDAELDGLRTSGQNKDLQLRMLRDKMNELGVHINFPPNLALTEVGEPHIIREVDKLQEHLKVCLQERKQLIGQVDELKTKLHNIPDHDQSDLQAKYDNICEEFENSEKLRLEHQEICIVLSTRLEELCHFLNHLLKQKAVLGFLGTEQTRKLQSVLSKSINLSQTLSASISLNPDQSLLQLTNISNLLDSTRNDSWNFDEFFTPDEDNNSYLSIVPSDVTLTYQNHLNRITAGNNTEQLEVIKVLRNQVANLKREIELRDVELEKKLRNDAVVENDDQFVNLLVDMQSKLGEACKSSNLDKSANTSTTLKNKTLDSESESWSEPDRNVSLARIGLNDEGVKKSLSKRNRFNNGNSFSTESTEDEEGQSLNKTPSKKGSLAESRQTIISLHEQVCDMELKLKDKENQLLAAQVAFYETDNFFKQEKIKYEEKKCENAQLTKQILYLEQKMDETSKEKANFERKVEVMELEHENLLVQIEEKNKKLDEAENKKRLAEEKIMELQRVIFALEDFRKNVEATMEIKDKEMNNMINKMEIEKSKAIIACESNAQLLEKAKADMLEAEEQLQIMHQREVKLKDELEANYSENLKKMEKDYEIQANRCRDAVIQIKNFYEKEYIKRSEVERRTLEVDGITKEVDKLKCTIQESETKMHGMENREMELTGKVNDLQKEHQNKIYELQEELDNATLQYSEAILEKTKLKSENIALEHKLQQTNDSIGKVSGLKKELQEVQSTLQVQISQLERQKSLLELKIKNLDAANSDLQCANVELHNRLIKLQINKSGGEPIPSMSLPNSPSNKSLQGLAYARQFSDHSGYASEDIPTSDTGSRGLLSVCVGSYTLPNIVSQVEVDRERVHANSSPDLGIESDHGRFSSLEANTNISRPLLPTLQLTESMSNLLDPVQDLSCANDGCCKKTKEIANENVELRKRLLRTRRALEETLNRLTLANKQKKEVEKSICKQIHKTSQVLRKAKANLDSGSETDLVKN